MTFSIGAHFGLSDLFVLRAMRKWAKNCIFYQVGGYRLSTTTLVTRKDPWKLILNLSTSLCMPLWNMFQFSFYITSVRVWIKNIIGFLVPLVMMSNVHISIKRLQNERNKTSNIYCNNIDFKPLAQQFIILQIMNKSIMQKKRKKKEENNFFFVFAYYVIIY